MTEYVQVLLLCYSFSGKESAACEYTDATVVNGATYYYRVSANNQSGRNDYTWVPAWFRLQRVGTLFTAYESSDGITWKQVGSKTVNMSKSYYLGLSVCSGKTELNTTTFDNITISASTKIKR